MLYIPNLSHAAVFQDTENQFIKPEAWGHTVDVAVSGTGTGQKESLLQVIKNGVNRVLAILGLIALIVLLWWGFQMVTAAGDDKKYDAGFTYVKEAAGWLVMIGVAWFIVSIIFYVIKLATT